MTEHRIHTTYRPIILCVCILLAFSLWASWLLLPSRAGWDAIDRQWFYWANGSLASGEHWQIFWASANHRAFDLIPGGILVGLFAWSAWFEHRRQLRERVAIGVFMAIFCVLTVQVVRLTVLEPRLSPTLVLPDAYRLTQLVPFIASKDSSTFSFPGDHATVMGMTACFIWYFCGRKYGIPAAIIAAICSIPRTVGGAHWLSDVLVSAPAIMLVAVALALATPFADWMIARIQTITTPLFNRFLPNL